MGPRALQTPGTSVDTVLGATERLRQSRQLMRAQMLELKASATQAQATESRRHGALLAALTALPVVGPLIDNAITWWAEHPLRAVAALFSRPNNLAAEPLTQRHPWALLLGAAAAGALLMWARPWRFALLRRAIYAGLLPQMATTLLSRVSADGLLDLIHSVFRPATNRSPPGAAKPPHAGRDDVAENSTLH
jgi:hypothetical protein